MLHIIQTRLGFQSALKYANSKDKYLLSGESIYALIDLSFQTDILKIKDQTYVLSSDLTGMGIEQTLIAKAHELDFDGFVTLTAKENSSITW